LGASGVVERLIPSDAVPIVREMGSGQQARILRKLRQDDAELILQDIKPNRAKEIRQLTSCPENTAGALMINEYLSYGGDMLVKDVLDDLRAQGEAYSDYDIHSMHMWFPAQPG
jgi:Mg/Co/Ni transporter MgtE